MDNEDDTTNSSWPAGANIWTSLSRLSSGNPQDPLQWSAGRCFPIASATAFWLIILFPLQWPFIYSHCYWSVTVLTKCRPLVSYKYLVSYFLRPSVLLVPLEGNETDLRLVYQSTDGASFLSDDSLCASWPWDTFQYRVPQGADWRVVHLFMMRGFNSRYPLSSPLYHRLN